MTSAHSLSDADASAIETQELRKVFGTQTAVRGLSLTVPRGAIFGFLGPNGAGKSTSIKMLLGLVRPTAGSARVLGVRVGDVAVRRAIGFLPEDFRFYEWLTAMELVRLHGRLSGMSATALRTRVPLIIERVGLAEHRNRALRGFSKGMLQRIGLAQALVHEPELVFLDEPTSGLDPMGRRLVRDILREERARGATVFLNSHLLSEIEVTCDHVAFIKAGEVIATRDLRGNATSDVHLTVRARNFSSAALEALAPLARVAEQREDWVSLNLRSPEAVPRIVRQLVQAGADVLEVTPTRQPLEDLFMELMGEDSGR